MVDFKDRYSDGEIEDLRRIDLRTVKWTIKRVIKPSHYPQKGEARRSCCPFRLYTLLQNTL